MTEQIRQLASSYIAALLQQPDLTPEEFVARGKIAPQDVGAFTNTAMIMLADQPQLTGIREQQAAMLSDLISNGSPAAMQAERLSEAKKAEPLRALWHTYKLDVSDEGVTAEEKAQFTARAGQLLANIPDHTERERVVELFVTKQFSKDTRQKAHEYMNQILHGIRMNESTEYRDASAMRSLNENLGQGVQTVAAAESARASILDWLFDFLAELFGDPETRTFDGKVDADAFETAGKQFAERHRASFEELKDDPSYFRNTFRHQVAESINTQGRRLNELQIEKATEAFVRGVSQSIDQ